MLSKKGTRPPSKRDGVPLKGVWGFGSRTGTNRDIVGLQRLTDNRDGPGRNRDANRAFNDFNDLRITGTDRDGASVVELSAISYNLFETL